MTARTRMFVAVRPPPEAAADLEAFLEPRREAGPAGLRWSDPAQTHLTLAFLPAVPDRVLEDLLEALAAAVGRRRTVSAAIAGGGAFPDVLTAKVLYAGLALDPADHTALEHLAAGVRSAANHVGAGADGGPFRPHVTVARLSRPRDVARLVGVLDTYRGPTWDAEEVELVASHLGEGPRGRPRHEVVATLRLSR